MKHRIYFILFYLLTANFNYAQKSKSVLKYDSTVVKIYHPTNATEQKVFKEVDLKFAKEVQSSELSLWDRFWKWLLHSIFGKADYQDKRNFQNIVLWVVVVTVVALATWLFSRSEFSSFLKGNTKSSEFSFSDFDEDIAAIDFDERIEKAKQNNDYRQAIRWLYLKQLYALNNLKKIVWQPYKTNIDYQNELSERNLKSDFKSISKIYEYVWYGKYSVSLTEYKNFELEFGLFNSLINV